MFQRRTKCKYWCISSHFFFPEVDKIHVGWCAWCALFLVQLSEREEAHSPKPSNLFAFLTYTSLAKLTPLLIQRKIGLSFWDLEGVLGLRFWDSKGVLGLSFWDSEVVLGLSFRDSEGVLGLRFWDLAGVLGLSFWDSVGVLGLRSQILGLRFYFLRHPDRLGTSVLRRSLSSCHILQQIDKVRMRDSGPG